MRPANGSAIVFQTHRTSGALSVARANGLRAGGGRSRRTADRRARRRRSRSRRRAAESRCCEAPTRRTPGTACRRGTTRVRPAVSSSCVSVPASKNFSISAVVGLGDHLDERVARRLGVGGERVGHRRLGHLAGLVGGERVRLHRDEIDHAFEVSSPRRSAAGSARSCGRASSRIDSSARSRLARSRSSRLQHDQPRQLQLLGVRPHLFGRDLHAADRVHDDDRRFGDAQRGARVARGSCPCPACRSD